MKLAQFQKSLTEMSDEEVLATISDCRSSRSTQTTERIKAVKKKNKKTDLKSMFASLSPEEKAAFKKALKGE